MHKTQATTGLKGVLLLGAATAAAMATPAFAQDQPQSKVETVVVTGSRIPATNLTSPSPVSVTTADQIQMTKATNLEDVLTKMTGPDVNGGTGENSNNGGVGASVIGLRNLGPTRTLVLVDGQRLLPVFLGTVSAPDLNSVPLSMIDRIEVLRDGASSVYGADAIGGVINLITKKDFSGLQIDVNGAATQHGGGDSFGLSGTLGANFDRGNVTFNVTHDFTGAVGGWDREWATAKHEAGGGHGSSWRFQNVFLEDSTFSDAYVNGTPRQSPNNPQNVPCSSFFPNFYSGYNLLNANCRSGYGDWNTLQGQLSRTQLSLNGHYDITPDVTFVLQGSYTARRSEQLLRPEPLLGSSISTTSDTGATIFPGFFVPANAHWGYPGGATKTADCPNVVEDSADPTESTADTEAENQCVVGELVPLQFGPRDYRQTSDSYRVRVGLQGHIFTDYNWEMGYVQQRANADLTTENSGQFQHLAQMLGEVPCVDVPGGCTAPGAVAGYPDSVPIMPVNFYNGPLMMNKAQLDYLRYTAQNAQQSYENYLYADVNGPIFDLPAGTIKGSIGVERRFEHALNQPDALVQAGYGANRTNPTFGGYGVIAAFGELYIPVLKDMPFVKMLEIRPSVRFDRYSNFGNATTWKIGADWSIFDDLRVRGTYSTNFRAPTAAELFGGNAISYLGVAGDPCDSRSSPVNGNTNMPTTPGEAAARLAPGTTCYTQLAALGLTPSQIANYQSPENSVSKDQRGFLVGGNPALLPETAHQWTVGAIITPHWIPGLSFGADYYEVVITNEVIGGIPISVGQDTFLLDAYASTTPPSGVPAGQNAAYAGLVTRTLTNGINQINSTNSNFGRNVVSGLDLETTYANDWDTLGLDMLPGSFTFNLQVSRQFLNYVTNPDGSVTTTLATFNSGTENVQPRWKGNVSFDWVFDAWALHWDAVWIGNTHNLDGSAPVYGNEIPDYLYHNISVAYDLGDSFKGTVVLDSTRLILGINNLFDKDPPYLNSDSVCKCNSIGTSSYDFAGRLFYMRLSTKL